MSNSSPLLNLPLELLLPILCLSFASHPTPSNVLRISSQIHTLSSPILYKHLYFRSPDAMVKFIENGKPSRRPRSVVVDLAGGAVGGGAFRALRGVFEKCLAVANGEVSANTGDDTSGGRRREGGQGGTGEWRLPLELLKLRLHSTSNSNTDDISLSALGLVDPETFIWTGPDPAHHFSIAIVPTAFRALQFHSANWTNLTSLHLSNIAFPSSSSPGLPPVPVNFNHSQPTIATSVVPQYAPLPIPGQDPDTGTGIEVLFPGGMPKLKRLYIGQATFVPLGALAAWICDRNNFSDIDVGSMDRTRRQRETVAVKLESVRLVDCYVESIWGSRVRRSDVERAACDLPLFASDSTSSSASHPRNGVTGNKVSYSFDSGIGLDDEDYTEVEARRRMRDRVVETVRRVVTCEAVTERIMGGDRVEAEGRMMIE